MVSKISNVKVNYDTAIYDHFPVSFNVTLPTHYISCNSNDRVRCDYVKWDKITANDKEMIRSFIDNEIVKRNLLECNTLACSNPNCDSDVHLKELINIFNESRCILLQSTEKFRFVNEKKFVIVPGWNDYVREFHKTARYYFLQWKDSGRPLFGELYEDMKMSRANFKNALDECKRNETYKKC